MPPLALIPCVSQEENAAAYQFKITGQKVFSLEEALFHVFHNWKQTVDDFCCEEFAAWVNDVLGLSFYASAIKRLSGLESFGERLAGFLRILDYFSPSELAGLQTELEDWEKRMEWEKLKERGDYAMALGEPSKAAALYRRALFFRRDSGLLNNAAVALMELEIFPEAMAYLEEAVEAETAAAPGVLPVRMLLNFAEAAIYARAFEEAERILKSVENAAEPHETEYLRGELAFEAGKPISAAERFEKAIGLKPEKRYIYRLAEVRAKMRQYERAEAALRAIPDRDTEYYLKLAEIAAAGDNPTAGAKAIEKALAAEPGSALLWTRLAMYRRLDYDAAGAQAAVEKALAIDPENDGAWLEQARIRKAAGRTKDYQRILRGVLKGFKDKYREIYGEI